MHDRRRVPEPRGDLRGRELLDEVRAQRLIAALRRLTGSAKYSAPARISGDLSELHAYSVEALSDNTLAQSPRSEREDRINTGPSEDPWPSLEQPARIRLDTDQAANSRRSPEITS